MENLKNKVKAEKETGIEEEKSESIPVFVACNGPSAQPAGDKGIDVRARRH